MVASKAFPLLAIPAVFYIVGFKEIAYLGSEGQKLCWTNYKDLMEQSEMRKTASKNIIPSESYEVLKIWVAIKLLYTQKLKRAISKRVQKVHSFGHHIC